MRHIISMLLENESGALARVAGLIAARGYNIESLSVAPTDDPSVSRMTVVTTGEEAIIEQITKQLNKLVDVIKLVDVTEGAHIERELMLVKVTCGIVHVNIPQMLLGTIPVLALLIPCILAGAVAVLAD